MQGRILIDFKDDQTSLAGGAGANRLASQILRSEFMVGDEPSTADLRIKSFSWESPRHPRRMFLDHGSFADASFWTYSAPRLWFDDTILVSSSVCLEVARRFILGEGPHLTCIPFAIDLELFKPCEDRKVLRNLLHAERGIPKEGPLLLVASAFVRRKNHHLALLFLRALAIEIPETHLAFVGETPSRGGELYRASLKDLIDQIGVTGSVSFLGGVPHEDLSRLMAAADLLVHFTNCRLENFGLVVGEAMAAGLPVVAADWGGLRDLVVTGDTGILAPTYLTEQGPRTDWLSVVRSVSQVLRDGKEWRRMSHNARKRAVRILNMEMYRSRLLRAVEAAIRRPHDDRPLALTRAGTELMFRTLNLNATHPEIVGTGDEYRLMMPLDGGKHYRLLTGPAASSESEPLVKGRDRLYPVVTWTYANGSLRVTDLAWPSSLTLDELQADIFSRCDGIRDFDSILQEVTAGPEGRTRAFEAAQVLVNQGVLCPVGAVRIRQSTDTSE